LLKFKLKLSYYLREELEIFLIYFLINKSKNRL